jgi:hypothetical protein
VKHFGYRKNKFVQIARPINHAADKIKKTTLAQAPLERRHLRERRSFFGFPMADRYRTRIESNGVYSP